MKRLIIALAAAVAVVTTASAKITVQQGFETDSEGFVASDPEEDSSAAVAYAEKEMALPGNDLAPYPLADESQSASFGLKYFEFDTGDTTVWCTNKVEGDVYFDMVMQFNPCAVAPELDDDTKIAVYLNTASNLVVISGDGSGGVATTVTAATLVPGSWARLTVAARAVNNALQFDVLTNGAQIAASSFACLTSDTTVHSVGFKGTGALDDYVARTTDPWMNGAVKIDGEEYASIQDAINDAGADAVIELLDNNADNVTLASNETLKLKKNGKNYTGKITLPDGYVVSMGAEDEQGVTTYAQVEGMARLNDTWYSTFAAAYDAASSMSDKLFVKISSDFTPVFTNPSGNNDKTFYSVTFTNTSESAVAIATTDGTSHMKTARWVFPENATLTVSYNFTVASVTGGAFEIPEDVVITMGGYAVFNNASAVLGKGTLKIASGDMAAKYFFDSSKVYTSQLLTTNEWEGTLELHGTYTDNNIDLSKCGNENSSIAFNGFICRPFGPSYSTTYNYPFGVKLLDEGLKIQGDYTRYNQFSGKLSGSGALTIDPAATKPFIYFTGDCSEFTGSISNCGSSSVIVFGSTSATGSGTRLIVASGASMTNAASATWLTAGTLTVNGNLAIKGTVVSTNSTPIFEKNSVVTIAAGATWKIPTDGANVHGNMVVDGAIRDQNGNVGKIYSNNGTAVVTANSATAFKLGNATTWKGTFVVGWNPDGAAFAINDFGDNDFSTIRLDGEDGVFSACIVGGADIVTNTTKIVVNSDTTFTTLGTTNILFTGSLGGVGSITVPSTKTEAFYLYFNGDASEFSGNISVQGDQTRLVFGDSTNLKGKSITVAAGKSITNAVAATWSAGDIGVHGELVANGTISIGSGKLWSDSGSGRYIANNVNAAVDIAESWNGTYVINYDNASDNTAVAIAKNVSATTVINGVQSGDKRVFKGYPATMKTGGTFATINGRIELNADWTVGNGWSQNNQDTRIGTLAGSGSLIVDGTSDQRTKGNKLSYIITLLDNYTGTLGGSIGTYTIGGVKVDSAPTPNVAVVKTDLGTGTITSPVACTYGESGTAMLVYSKTAGTGDGLYLAVARVGADGYYALLSEAMAVADASSVATITKLAPTSEPIPDGWKLDPVSGNYVKISYVAQIGDKTYETLKDAVDGAKDGDVITLLDNIVLDTRVEPNVGAGTSLAINLGGYTLTRTGTSGNGSVIDVKSGNVIVTNGVIDCTQNDAEIVADGVYALTARSGSTLTLDDLTVAVDSQAGACVYPFNGAYVTINGGIYSNATTAAYQYKPAWTGMAVNQENVATQLVTINSGRFSQVDPAEGDDSGLCTTFLAAGKATTLVDGYWTVGVATYTVNFIVDDVTNKTTVAYNEKATAPAAPTKAGYTFTGWTPDTNDVITANTDFCAVWAGKVFTIYTCTNGVVNASTNFTYAGETVAPANPVFNSETEEWDGKWYTSNGGSGEFAFNPDGDTTQHAYATITAKSSPIVPVDPAEDITPPAGKTAEVYAADINAAIESGKGDEYINVPAAATDMKAQYLALLKAEVNKSDSTKIDIVFNTESTGYAAVTNALETTAVPAVGESLSTIAAGATATTANVTITSGLTPGLYYWISYCTEIGNFGTQYEAKGARVIADASGAATLTTPAKTSTQQGFYRVNVNVSDK